MYRWSSRWSFARRLQPDRHHLYSRRRGRPGRRGGAGLLLHAWRDCAVCTVPKFDRYVLRRRCAD